MAVDTQINLILKLILAGDFDKALALFQGLVAETKELEKAAEHAGDSEKQAAKEKLSNLEKIRNGLKEVREAQKLLSESTSAEDEAAAFELLEEVRRKLSKTVDEANKAEETANKKKLADIRQLQQQIQLLTEKQKQLQQAIKQGDTGKSAELSNATAQIGALQSKITALRTGQQQLTQSSQAIQSSFQQTVTLAEGLNGKFQALGQSLPPAAQGFGNVGTQVVNVAKALGPMGLAVAGATTLLTLAGQAAVKFGEDTAFAAKTQLAIQRSTGASASFIASLTTIIKSYGGEVQNVQELLLQTGSVINTAIANPVGESAERFKKLGIEVKDAAGKAKSIEQVLRDIDKVASSTALTTEQLTIVSGIFGEEASKQFLDQVGNFAKIEERLKKTGAVISDELTELSRKYNDAGQLIQAQTDGITFALGGEIIPYLLDIKRYASEAIEAIDPNDLEGIKAIIGDIGGLLKTLGTTTIDLASTSINLLGNLATGVDALLNPIDTLKTLLNIYPATTEKADIGTQKLVKAFVSGTFAAEELSKKINQLANDQKFLGDITQTIADTQILAVQQRLKQGLIDEQTAAEEISRLEKRKVDQKAGFEEDKLKRVQKSLDDEVKRRQDAAKQEDKILQDITARKKQAESDLLKIKEEAFQREVSLEAFASKSKQGQEELEKEKERNKTLISLAQQRVNQLTRAEQEATINGQKASKDLADFKAGTNLAVFVDEKKLKDEVLKVRTELQQATLGLEQSRLAKYRETTEEIKRKEQSIVDERTKRIQQVDKQETESLKNLQATLNQGLISRTQFEQDSLAIKLSADKDRLIAENDALIKINNLNGASEEVKTKLKQDASTRRQSVDKQEFDQGVKLAQDAANARKALLDAESAQRQADINKQKAAILEISNEKLKLFAQQDLERAIAKDTIAEAEKKIQLEKDNLEVLKKQGATKEELERQEKLIVLAISDGTKARAEQLVLEKKQLKELDDAREKERAENKKILDEKTAGIQKSIEAQQAENKAVEDLGDRANSVVDKLKGGAVALGDAFDIQTAKITALDDRLEQLAEHRNFIANLAAIPDKDVFINEINNTIDAINAEKIRRVRVAAEQQRAIELAELQKEKQEAFQIFKSLQEEQLALTKDYQAKERSLNKELKQSEKDEAEDLKNFSEQQAGELTVFDNEQAEKRKAKATEERQHKEEEAQATVDNIKEINRKAAEDEADARIKALTTIGEKQGQIAALQAKEQTAETKAEIEKLQKELKALEGDEAARRKRVEGRDDEIAKAQQTAQEKLKNAKTKEEVDAIQEELRIATEGINNRFQIEEQKLQKLKDLQGKASKETLDAIAAEFETKKKIAQDEEKALLESAQRKAAQQAAALEAQAKAEKEAADKARQDFLDRQKKEFDDRKKGFDDKQQQLKDALTKERDEYNKHLSELETKTAKSLAEMGKSFTDGGAAADKFFADFIKNSGLSAKAIDDILKKLKQFKDEAASDAQQSGAGSGSSPSTPPPSSSSGNVFGGGNSGQSGSGLGAGFSGSGAGGNTFNRTAPNITTTNATTGASTSQSNAGASPSTSASPNASPTPSAQPSADQNRQTGGSVKSQPSQQPSPSVTVPSKIATADEYSKIAFELLNIFEEKFFDDYIKNGVGKSGKITDLFNKLSKANYAYMDGAGLTQEEKAKIAPGTPYLFNSKNKKENRKIFISTVQDTINNVEAKRKAVGGTDKGAGVAGDIPTKSGDITTPGLSSDPKGSTKGDVTQTPTGNIAPPPPVTDPKDPVNVARDEALDTGYEGEGAEKKGATPFGPNAPTPLPTAPDNTNSSSSSSSSSSNNPTSQPDSNNFNRTTDPGAGATSQAITATATIDKLINIENFSPTITLPPGSAGNKEEITKEMANSMIDAIMKEVPERPDLVNLLAGELNAKDTNDFLARNPLRAYKV